MVKATGIRKRTWSRAGAAAWSDRSTGVSERSEERSQVMWAAILCDTQVAVPHFQAHQLGSIRINVLRRSGPRCQQRCPQEMGTVALSRLRQAGEGEARANSSCAPLARLLTSAEKLREVRELECRGDGGGSPLNVDRGRGVRTPKRDHQPLMDGPGRCALEEGATFWRLSIAVAVAAGGARRGTGTPTGSSEVRRPLGARDAVAKVGCWAR